MLLLLVLLDVGVIGALYWMWRKVLKDAGLAFVATAVCAVLISILSSVLVLAVM
jgi:hypothetical protein